MLCKFCFYLLKYEIFYYFYVLLTSIQYLIDNMKSLSFLVILFGLNIIWGCNKHDKNDCNAILYIGEIKEVRYIPELTGDSIYWEIVKCGINNVPNLIDMMNDTTETMASVPNFGGQYTIGDIAYCCLEDIVRIRGNKLIPDSAKNGGQNTYWAYLRNGYNNRLAFQKEVRLWFQKNKRNLKWKEDKLEYRTGDNWKFPSKTHPAGGYYVIRK